MAKVGALFFLLLLSLTSGGNLITVNGQQKTWCVAKPSANDASLQSNINFSCNEVVGCKDIQSGGACNIPDTLINHASVVMNIYYQINGRNPWNCFFNGSALITTTDPSYDKCNYLFE